MSRVHMWCRLIFNQGAKLMELFESVVGWMVAMVSFVIWALFLPQIKLLYRVKDSQSLSLLTVYGSLAVQTLIFTRALLKSDFKLALLQSTSMFFLGIIICMAHYYRRYPGGRKGHKERTEWPLLAAHRPRTVRPCRAVYVYIFISNSNSLQLWMKRIFYSCPPGGGSRRRGRSWWHCRWSRKVRELRD